MPIGLKNNILNQKGTPAFYSDTFANRPAFGFAGRVFISTDTGAIYEDTGTAWTLIADAGAGTTGTLQQVTTNGNTTTQGISITAGGLSANNVKIEGNGTTGDSLYLKQFASATNNLSGYSGINTLTNGQFYFSSARTAPNFANFAIDTSLLSDNTLRTFNLPNVSGTLALTSNLSSYVPYTGATGAVNLGAYDLTVNTVKVGLGGGNISTNTAIGVNALNANTSGNFNTAIGYDTLFNNINGSQNTAIGDNALVNVTSGSGNIAIGFVAGQYITTGSKNVFIGKYGGTGGTQSNNVVLADGDGNVRFIDNNGAAGIPSTLAIGSQSIPTGFSATQFYAGLSSPAETHIYNMGVVGTAQANSGNANIWGVGVYGAGYTNGGTRSAGVQGDGEVTASADTGSAIGVRGYATATHAGGLNIGMLADATGSSTGNYGYYTNMASAANTYAQYHAGTATSFFGGEVLIKGTGTTTGTYGLFVENSALTTTFYVNDAGYGYFAANVGIGTNPTSSDMLTVNGTGMFSGALGGTSATFSQTTSNKLTLSGGSTQNGLTLDAVSGFGNSFYIFNGNGGLGNGFGIYNTTTSTLPFYISNTGAATLSGLINANSGVKFAGGASTLNYYEEGTWTPTVFGSDTAGTYTLNNISASYTRIGNLVTIQCGFGFSAASGGVGFINIGNLPFNYAANSRITGIPYLSNYDFNNILTKYITVLPPTSGSANYLYFAEILDNASSIPSPISGVNTSTIIFFSLTYKI